MNGARRISAILLLLALSLAVYLAGCRKQMTDEEYQDLALSYYIDDNRSEEAVQAVECSQGRDTLETVAKGLGNHREALQGAPEAEVREAIAEQYPNGNRRHLDSLWEGCPAGGIYVVGIEAAKPLYDGTKMFKVEVYCTVHTPDAYASYQERLDEQDD